MENRNVKLCGASIFNIAAPFIALLLGSFLSFTTCAQTTVEYIHTDALGSPVAITDASGNIVEREVYEPYGSPITRPPSDQPGFTGHVADSLTGLTYMQQRYYDPQIGRFLSVDPVTAFSNPIGAFNRYWYAANNPYKFTDPDGRCHTSTGKCMTPEEFDRAWSGEAGRVLNAIGSPLGVAADLMNGDVKSAAVNAAFFAIPEGKAAAQTAGFAARSAEKAVGGTLVKTAAQDFNQARNSAMQWLGDKGFKAETATVGKFGSSSGKNIGMQTVDGKVGFRIEFDSRSGAHINVWAGKEKGPHFSFNATPKTVEKIWDQFSK